VRGPQPLEPPGDDALMDTPGQLARDGEHGGGQGHGLGVLHELLITLDGTPHRVGAGDAVGVHPGSTLAVENPGDGTAVTWVTTSPGLEATLDDGTRIAPPWTR